MTSSSAGEAKMARLILCVAVVMVAVVNTVAEGSGEKARRQEKLLERLLRYEKENSHVKVLNFNPLIFLKLYRF